MTAHLHAFLASLEPGPATQLGPLTVLPLRSSPRGPAVSLLGPDTAEVREKGARGVVGEVEVHNRTVLPLLLIAGELLIGAKQNRLVNASTLVDTGATQTLRVSCVEQGRWDFGRRREGFRAGGVTAPWALRSRSHRSSSRSKRLRGVSRADQSEVWSSVRATLHHRDVSSETMDLTDAMRGDHVARILQPWKPDATDVGAALFIGDRLVGVEAFGRPDTWAAAAHRVLSGVVHDAPADAAPPTDPGAAWRALRDRVQHLDVSPAQGDGLGDELHGEDEEAHLVALLHQEAVVHLRIARLIDSEDTPEQAPRHHHRRRSVRDATVPPGPASTALPPVGNVAGRLRGRLRRSDAPELRLDQLTIVTRERDLARLLRHTPEATALPLPRQVAGGLAAWPVDPRTVEALTGTLERLGFPRHRFAVIDPARPDALPRRPWLLTQSPAAGVVTACTRR